MRESGDRLVAPMKIGVVTQPVSNTASVSVCEKMVETWVFYLCLDRFYMDKKSKRQPLAGLRKENSKMVNEPSSIVT
jgi:hypothetical protein